MSDQSTRILIPVSAYGHTSEEEKAKIQASLENRGLDPNYFWKCLEALAEDPSWHTRVETGTLKFHNDWSGTFLRGDNGMYYSMMIEMLARKLENPPEGVGLCLSMVEQLGKLLGSARET